MRNDHLKIKFKFVKTKWQVAYIHLWGDFYDVRK